MKHLKWGGLAALALLGGCGGDGDGAGPAAPASWKSLGTLAATPGEDLVSLVAAAAPAGEGWLAWVDSRTNRVKVARGAPGSAGAVTEALELAPQDGTNGSFQYVRAAAGGNGKLWLLTEERFNDAGTMEQRLYLRTCAGSPLACGTPTLVNRGDNRGDGGLAVTADGGYAALQWSTIHYNAEGTLCALRADAVRCAEGQVLNASAGNFPTNVEVRVEADASNNIGLHFAWQENSFGYNTGYRFLRLADADSHAFDGDVTGADFTSYAQTLCNECYFNGLATSANGLAVVGFTVNDDGVQSASYGWRASRDTDSTFTFADPLAFAYAGTTAQGVAYRIDGDSLVAGAFSESMDWNAVTPVLRSLDAGRDELQLVYSGRGAVPRDCPDAVVAPMATIGVRGGGACYEPVRLIVAARSTISFDATGQASAGDLAQQLVSARAPDRLGAEEINFRANAQSAYTPTPLHLDASGALHVFWSELAEADDGMLAFTRHVQRLAGGARSGGEAVIERCLQARSDALAECGGSEFGLAGNGAGQVLATWFSLTRPDTASPWVWRIDGAAFR